MATVPLSFDMTTLRAAYREGRIGPTDIVKEVYARIGRRGDDNVWIHLAPQDEVLAIAKDLEERGAENLPLFGFPFAIKDNIDWARHPTTAACPAYAYTPDRSAAVVQRLIDSGAIPIGKTNLDQFATGLVGTRSPFGAPSSVFSKQHISGGSSSGSAVAVAAGLVSFSLGTDTAGSGRVPAMFNNIVGLKPSRGLISTRGVVPACRSLDCVSIFALTGPDALEVLRVAAGFDAEDPFSRHETDRMDLRSADRPERFGFGVPSGAQLEFFGAPHFANMFEHACQRLIALGGERIEVDFSPFAEAAALLYDGPWVAERTAAIADFMTAHPEALHPVTRAIIEKGRHPTALEAFRAYYRLRELRRAVESVWTHIDCLVLPTAGRHYTHAEVDAEPIRTNTNLGRYTNFVNLLDLCGVAVPAGFTPDQMPLGVTLLAPAFREAPVLAIGDALHRDAHVTLGGTGVSMVDAEAELSTPPPAPSGWIRLCVIGAHMRGLPLNAQLVERGGRFVRDDRTAPVYRMYALTHLNPPRPGMQRVDKDGASIALEVWELSQAAFGDFVASIPGPLGIGSVELSDGSQVKGFLGEDYAMSRGEDITHLGGWRRYLEDNRP